MIKHKKDGLLELTLEYVQFLQLIRKYLQKLCYSLPHLLIILFIG